jgi:hypothetical protein
VLGELGMKVEAPWAGPTAVAFGGLASMSQLVFLSGLVAFFLLGVGQFNCMFIQSQSLIMHHK